MTFDLHYSNDKKPEVYRMWVRRIYSVANTLGMSYSELWELSEQEFLVLEELAKEVQESREQQRKEILAQGGNR